MFLLCHGTGSVNWSPAGPLETSVRLDGLIWADDLSTPLAIHHAEEAAKAVMSEAGALTDSFAAHGFALCFGPRKTAALVCPDPGEPGNLSAAANQS